jgi:hypothetical protein
MIHKENFDLLQLSGGSLDWSLACPGNMFDSPDGRAPADPSNTRVVADEAPISLPGWSRHVPTALLLPAVATARQQARRGAGALPDGRAAPRGRRDCGGSAAPPLFGMRPSVGLLSAGR